MSCFRRARLLVTICFALVFTWDWAGAVTNSPSSQNGPSFLRSASSQWFILPLNSSNRWQVLRYRKISENKISFSKGGLEIWVRSSASPLIYPLDKPIRVTGLRVKGKIEGKLEVDPARQGEKGNDDYVLRIGLVVPGEKRLNFVQRRTAPDWVRSVFRLAPKGTGISRVLFFNVAVSKDQIGKVRQHPASDLLYEKIIAVPGTNGGLSFSHSLDQAVETLAIWISSDGDDSKSNYRVQISQIELEVK